MEYLQRYFFRALFLFVLLSQGACLPENSEWDSKSGSPAGIVRSSQTTLILFAASSLTEAFTEMGNAFSSSTPAVEVVINFGSSYQLSQQLALGAKGDVFASANDRQMEMATKAGRVAQGSSRIFARNRLVVVFPEYNSVRIRSLQDLAREDLKIVLAHGEVPAGKYAMDFLERASKHSSFGSLYRDRVMDNVVSYEQSVRSVLAKVALGEADAGIVYASDLTSVNVSKVKYIEIPDELNPRVAYPIAPVRDSQSPELAKDFIDFVLSEKGQAILTRYGFDPAGAS